jgi:hypothetical protein
MIRRSFDLAVCNAMAGSGVEPERSARIVRNTLREFPDAVLVGVVEASLLLNLERFDWTPTGESRDLRLIQRGPLDKAGVAAFIDRKRLTEVTVKYRVGVRPFINGRRIGMRTRHIMVVRGRVDDRRKRKFKVGHLPPKRFWAIWRPMIRRFGPTGADLGDFNRFARAVQPATHKRASMDALIGILTPWSWRVTNKRVVDVGGDHNAVGVTVHHPRKRKEKSS